LKFSLTGSLGVNVKNVESTLSVSKKLKLETSMIIENRSSTFAGKASEKSGICTINYRTLIIPHKN